jgi:KDO2-lipid IV(A) lauroyltransferase
VLYLIRPIERHVRRHLASERNRQRFDRAKRFVDERVARSAGEASRPRVSYQDGHGISYTFNLVGQPPGPSDASAHRIYVRWLRFLCRQTSVQRDIWPQHIRFLRHFAAAFGMPASEQRAFIDLSLFGRLWRTGSHRDLAKGPTELVAQLTQVEGWEHFERCRQDGAGLIVLPFHSQFVRLFQRYLLHRGYEGLELGHTSGKLKKRGIATPIAQKFELARQMQAAKLLLTRGGIVYNLPDARENLDNARAVEFFGRERPLATGFAELALKTGARVITVAHRLSPRGHFVMDFGPTFYVPPADLTHDQRIDALVAQYAEFLRNEWRRYPWNVHWEHLRYYCGEVGADLPDDAEDAGRGQEFPAAGSEFSLEFAQSRSG